MQSPSLFTLHHVGCRYTCYYGSNGYCIIKNNVAVRLSDGINREKRETMKKLIVKKFQLKKFQLKKWWTYKRKWWAARHPDLFEVSEMACYAVTLNKRDYWDCSLNSRHAAAVLVRGNANLTAVTAADLADLALQQNGAVKSTRIVWNRDKGLTIVAGDQHLLSTR